MAHAVEIEALGKYYVLGRHGQGYSTLRESLSSLGRRRRPGGDGIWALRAVDLAVEEGEVLGVIGPNGAGKTTLLKILTRITQPTTGVTRTRGRVGVLLEVGTGFHPELTGRENVFLNGAILGIRRREMRQKFDEIVEFAELERFIDTPVKRYSSGMHMRLGFAVAAHLEPEVLIVDEVLAVGDAMFQKKSLGKMDEVAQNGRTVLFVSHNMAAIESLCSRVVRLDQGRVVDDGAPRSVVSRYLTFRLSDRAERIWEDPLTPAGNEKIHLMRASARPLGVAKGEPFTIQTPIRLEFEYVNRKAGAYLNLSVHVFNEQGILVFNAVPNEDSGWYGRPLPTGRFRDICEIPARLLNDGAYRIELLIVENDTEILHKEEDALSFTVVDTHEGRGSWYGDWLGVVRPAVNWETELVSPANGQATSST